MLPGEFRPGLLVGVHAMPPTLGGGVFTQQVDQPDIFTQRQLVTVPNDGSSVIEFGT